MIRHNTYDTTRQFRVDWVWSA